MTAELPSLREVIRRHGLSAEKRFGQHFLLDPSITRRIAESAGDLSSGTTIEVGPGPGGLTRALLDAGAAHVLAVEVDRRAVAAIGELAATAHGRLEIVEADALALDLASAGQSPRRIVANLPYNVGTRLLLDWLLKADAFESMTLMFQKEVGDRLVARRGDAAYGRLSVLARYLCRVERVFDLPPGAFVPPPKVASTVIRLLPHRPMPNDPPAGDLGRVTAAAFGQRRKMLRASLRSLVPDPIPLLETAGIRPEARAEEVELEGFVALTRAWRALSSRP